MKSSLVPFAIAALCVLRLAPSTHAAPEDIPISGRPVPELTDLDDMMRNFMDANTISAGVLGIMQSDGRIAYQRGFGWDFDGDPLPENAPMRLASLTKGITAAAAREQIADGLYALGDRAFEVGQAVGGLLNVTPAGGLGDPRIGNITVTHLLHHRGGWDRDIDDDGTNETVDWTYQETNIAAQMGVASPPGRVSTMDFILGQPLQRNPGTGNSGTSYSNTGYLALALIGEQVTGQSHLAYIRQNVLTPRRWVPSTEVFAGRTFRAQQNPREPEYDDPNTVTSVFDSVPGDVDQAYGGWDHEARVGQGGIVASAAAMLTLADNYQISYGGNNMGVSLAATPLSSNQTHTGSFPTGTNTAIRQRTDGLRIFVAFNKDDNAAGSNFANTMRGQVETYLDNNAIALIGRTSDGFWTRHSGRVGKNLGGYHQPFATFPQALADTTAGSKLRLFPGKSSWTGKISERTRLDAPLGVATIGKP